METPPDFVLSRASTDRIDEALRLVSAFHDEEGVTQTTAARRAAVGTLLADPSRGALHLIEAEGRPVGYLAVAYGFSIEFGGRDAFLDEFFIEQAWRGAGLGAAALRAAQDALARQGVLALHLEVGADNAAARRFYGRAGFALRGGYHLMSARLSGDGEETRRRPGV